MKIAIYFWNRLLLAEYEAIRADLELKGKEYGVRKDQLSSKHLKIAKDWGKIKKLFLKIKILVKSFSTDVFTWFSDQESQRYCELKSSGFWHFQFAQIMTNPLYFRFYGFWGWNRVCTWLQKIDFLTIEVSDSKSATYRPLNLFKVLEKKFSGSYHENCNLFLK